LRKRTGAIEVSVADTGVGVDSKDIIIFLSLLYGPTMPKSVSKGVGIGLVVVKGFLEAQGCKISVFSAGKEKGTTFTITIPTV